MPNSVSTQSVQYLLQQGVPSAGLGGHKEFCSEAVDERKIKQTAKERGRVGRDSVKEDFAKVKEANKGTDKGKEWTKEVKKMCNEMMKSKKAPEGAGK